MSKTKVRLRETNQYKEISYRKKEDDDFQEEMIHKWQTIIDIGTKVLGVDAGLIMKITKENMEVFLKSNTENNPYPFDGKDSLGHGLYCETVIGNNESLFIDDSLSKPKWKDNPDVALDMISYLGYPIRYPNGDFFGTICTLDRSKMVLSDEQFEFLKILRDSIEKDLVLVEKMKHIQKLTTIDHLTGVFNRRYMSEKLEECQAIISRSDNYFLITTIDLNNLKSVNDTFGHSKGDKVIKTFASIVKNRLRKTDYFGRFGGDEFLVISLNTDESGFKEVIKDIQNQIQSHEMLQELNMTFAYGSAIANKDVSIEKANTIADDLMYQRKRDMKNR